MDEAATINGRKSSRKLLAFVSLLALNEGIALSPVPPPAVPPEIRLTISLKEIALGSILDVYRAFEQAATRAELTCEPTMKDYQSWREKGFEPTSRNMVCHDAHTVLIDASWVNVAPKLITMDFNYGSQTEPSRKSRVEQLVRELEKSLKADPAVTGLTQDTWSPAP
jgi:hypothetical protein